MRQGLPETREATKCVEEFGFAFPKMREKNRVMN